MASTVRVDGLRELGERMRKLSADMAGKVARQATAAGAKIVRDQVRVNAPKDTGNLAAAVVMKRITNSSLSAEYVVAVRKGKRTDVANAKSGQGKLGKDAYYAHMVEFGTVKMSAQPFIRPAFESQKNAAVDAIASRLKKRLDRLEK